MAVSTVLTITSGTENAADIAELLATSHTDKYVFAEKVADYMKALSGGCRSGSIDAQIDGGDAVAASGTITFSGTGAASDTVLINGVTFTAVASGATGNQWNVGGSATLSAAALAAAIVASATALVNAHVTATAASGVVTITSKFEGVQGNAVTIAEGVDGSSHMAVSGARLTGGTAATANTKSFGI